MTRYNPYARLAGSPLLVGTITVLIGVVAVFLSYNANAGLPFVPTYDIKVQVPDAAGLVRGNEARIGGKRVGVIQTIGTERVGGRAVGLLALKLETRAKPIRSDTLVMVRPRSPLGLKYLELQPGERGRALDANETLPLAQSRPIVDLDEVINAFGGEARNATRGVLRELGTGLTGRGQDFNSLLAKAPPLLTRGRRVAANLSSPPTGLGRFIRALALTSGELDRAGSALGSGLEAADTTAGAFAESRTELAEGITELGPTELAGTRALRASRPVLRDAAALARDLRPAGPRIEPASRRLHAALRVGIPVLGRVSGLADRLEGTLAAVEKLSRDPATSSTLERLTRILDSLKPTLDYAAPFQLRCNYLGLWTRNAPGAISEGDAGGTWFRSVIIQHFEETSRVAAPAPELHVNTYPNTAAPGQSDECEAGNEPFLPGQRIGNVPGVQATGTEQTAPPTTGRSRP